MGLIIPSRVVTMVAVIQPSGARHCFNMCSLFNACQVLCLKHGLGLVSLGHTFLLSSEKREWGNLEVFLHISLLLMLRTVRYMLEYVGHGHVTRMVGAWAKAPSHCPVLKNSRCRVRRPPWLHSVKVSDHALLDQPCGRPHNHQKMPRNLYDIWSKAGANDIRPTVVLD